MAKQNENNKNKDCKDCIYKNHKETVGKKIIESLKQLEGDREIFTEPYQINAYLSKTKIKEDKGYMESPYSLFV